jgi:Response regulator containing a CheY-like receiver domain and an HTH DNA-binding domain
MLMKNPTFSVYGNNVFMVAGIDTLIREVFQEMTLTDMISLSNRKFPDCWVLSTTDEKERFSLLSAALIKGNECIVFGSSYLKLILDGVHFPGIVAIIDIEDRLPDMKNAVRKALIVSMQNRKTGYPEIQSRFSALEFWILELIMYGYTTSEISFWTGRNIKNIYRYRRIIMQKIKAESIQELYVRARDMGIRHEGAPKILPGDVCCLL